MKETSKKVFFSEYENGYNVNFKTKMESFPDTIDLESMRANLYGYTFTEEFARGIIPDELSMDYWSEYIRHKFFPTIAVSNEDTRKSVEAGFWPVTPQELLLLKAIDSTGDGETPDSALCVISVHQEYEYIERSIRFTGFHVARQSFFEGIDCLELNNNDGETTKVFFDLRRYFEVKTL